MRSAERRTTLAVLRDWTRHAKKTLYCAYVCIFFAGVLLIVQAGLIARLVHRVVMMNHAPALLVKLFCLLLLTGLGRALLLWIAQVLSENTVTIIQIRLRSWLIARLFEKGPAWLRVRSSGALSELSGSHIDALKPYFSGYLPVRFETLVVPIVMLIAVFRIDVIVGSLLLLTMPLIPLFMMLVGWGAEAASRRQLKSLARMSGYFADRLRGLGVIRIFGRGAVELTGVAQAAESVRENSLKVLRIAFLSSAVLEFFASISVALVAVYLGLTHLGMIDFRSTPLTLEMSLFCLLLAPEYFSPMRRLAAHYHDRAHAFAAIQEIETQLNVTCSETAASAHETQAVDLEEVIIAPAVLIRDLSIRHAMANEPAVRHLDLQIEPGEHVALVGPSGCGKSTLLDHIAGVLSNTSGTMVIQPHPQRIGYATQKPFLFHGSIADNIRLGCPNATRAAIEEAAEAAQVMRFARTLPAGLDTPIGERGFGLSGGEARRVALARLYLQTAPLLLLDEPTAFLDPDTERALLEALVDFAAGRTLVMATHSTVAMQAMGRIVQPFPVQQGIMS